MKKVLRILFGQQPNANSQLLAEGGYLMPTIIILMVVIGAVAYSVMVQASNSLNLSYKEAYIEMARSASKAAIDYAQEQFDAANCGNYSGTAETDLTGASNSRYRITMQAEVLSTSQDGFEKKIKGTGRIYLPKASAQALYVFDIRSEIVRTYAVCKTPDNFGPLVWLDASDINTLRKAADTNHLDANTAFGSTNDSTRDTVEERVDNGQQGGSSWSSNDLEMHTCDNAEFSASVCTNNATKYLYDGIIFSSVNVPKDSSIVSAIMTVKGATPSGISGSLTHRVCGIYETATNPHKALFTSSGVGQIRTRLQTGGLHTQICQDTTTNNFPPGNTLSFDVTNVLQEMVSHNGWDPGANNGRAGFAVYRMSGSGSRTALKDNIKLSVNYNTGNNSPSDNGDIVTQWNDKSPNQYNAKLAYGNAPTRQDNQINGKTIVRFSGGAFLSSLTTPLSGKREFSVFAVSKPNFGTSSAQGRLVSGMTATDTSDTSSATSLIPLRRQNNATGFNSFYATGGEVNMGCNPTCNNTPYLVNSVFQIDTTNNTIAGKLRGNGGSQSGQTTGINPGAPPPPYTFGINQLYFAGRRTGALPGSGIDYFNGDYAELVVYDKALNCHDVENLEEYFRAKWAINPSQWADNCPPDTIPTL